MSDFTDAMVQALERIRVAETREERVEAEDAMALLIRKQVHQESTAFDPKAAACGREDE